MASNGGKLRIPGFLFISWANNQYNSGPFSPKGSFVIESMAGLPSGAAAFVLIVFRVFSNNLCGIIVIIVCVRTSNTC